MAKTFPVPEEAVDGDIVVTTSDFVRRFGTWQERALREPVYILHRGRPRFVMISVETMQQLCEPRAAPTDQPAIGGKADRALLDLVDDMVLLLDGDLEIVASTAAARRYFGTALDQHGAVGGLPDGPAATIIEAALRRVLASGLAETIDVAAPYPARVLSWSITPYLGGVAMMARDATVIDDLAAAHGAQRAFDAALLATGAGVTLRLNLRGHIVGAAPSLATMVGLSASALAGIRFATLIERATRVAVSEAIDAVIVTGENRGVDTDLLVGGHATRPVRIGMAPIRTGATIEGVAALILDTASLRQA